MIDMSAVRAKTAQLLKEHNVPMHPYLPVLEHETCKSPVALAEKIVVLYTLAGLANDAAGELLKEWLVEEGGWAFLTEAEQKIIEDDDLTEEEINEFAWKEESLFALCWCGFIVDEMPWPTREGNLLEIFPSIPPEVPISEFVGSLEMRPAEQIIQMLDVYYCLDAAMGHPEMWKDNQSIDQLDLGVILERRQALEWVYLRSEAWDEITLDT